MEGSSLGPFERLGKVLLQDPEIATDAGHHSVIRIPVMDEYYIIYHRHPKGNTDGTHRETCIERMNFDKNGYIENM